MSMISGSSVEAATLDALDTLRRTSAPSFRTDPATQALLDRLAGTPPLYTLTPDAARAALVSLQREAQVRPADVTRQDRILTVGPAGRTRVRVIRPADATGLLPGVIYMHGGGWVLGDATTHDRLVCELAVGADAAMVFVDYERSPGCHYPVAIEQGYAVLSYVAEFGEEMGIDPERIAIAGDSVGGNMATVLALIAKERHGPSVLAQLMFYPVTDASMSTRTYQEFAEGPGLTRKAMAWFWDQYMPNADARRHVHASPINASLAELEGLPPALLLVGEYDVLRDEGEAYGRRLAQAGVPVTSVRYNGAIHDFMMLDPLADSPATRAAVAEACGYLRTALAQR